MKSVTHPASLDTLDTGAKLTCVRWELVFVKEEPFAILLNSACPAGKLKRLSYYPYLKLNFKSILHFHSDNVTKIAAGMKMTVQLWETKPVSYVCGRDVVFSKNNFA
jgi:hypothetical protein